MEIKATQAVVSQRLVGAFRRSTGSWPHGRDPHGREGNFSKRLRNLKPLIRDLKSKL